MLVQFSVENYRSIKERIILSMLASKDREHIENTISTGTTDRCLKSSVIFGANAAGKSNVLNAFWFVVNYVLNSHEKQLNLPTGRTAFLFDPETPNAPSKFEMIFIIDGVKYTYGFSATDKEVVEEYLYYYPHARRAVIFEREETNKYRFTIDNELQQSLKERNTHNKLYLSTAANWNYAMVRPVFDWFASCSVLNTSRMDYAYGIDGVELRDDTYRSKIAQALRVADFGIQGLKIKDGSVSFMGTWLGVLDNIEAVHQVRNLDGSMARYGLSMAEESTGTNTYFCLIGVVEKALQSGGLVVADELDSDLHPLLTQHLLSLFNSEETNPHGAQIIFSSHNTSLLDLEIMRRDQIWFVEKNEDTAATDLFSLYDFSVRKDSKAEKSYLLGRFGAIPFIKGGTK